MTKKQDIEYKIPASLLKELFHSWRKPETDPFARAVLIQQILDIQQTGYRTFARRNGFKEQTIKDWLSFKKYDKSTLERLTRKGFTKSEVFRAFRNTKGSEKAEEYLEHKANGELSASLKTCIELISPHELRPKKDEETDNLIIELICKLQNIQRKLAFKC